MKQKFVFIILITNLLYNCENQPDNYDNSKKIGVKIETEAKIKNEIKDSVPLVKYYPNNNIQKPFETKELHKASVTIFPNYGSRNHQLSYYIGNNSYSYPNNYELKNVYGINQFFMDFDLTTGFVHPYTANFYNKLPKDGFVLYYERNPKYINQGEISYKRKKDLTVNDILGQNIGFCRQWKLSEIEILKEDVFMRKNNSGSYSMQVKSNTKNPYEPEIPIRSIQISKDGYYKMDQFNILSNLNGGTAVIIWETKTKEILFLDIHGSIYSIINKLIDISNKYNVDPTLGIYDAGPMSQKLKADDNNSVFFSEVNSWCDYNYVGAGYAYNLKQNK